MLKLSRTGLTILKRRYKSVLLKCLAINAAALMAAGVANAEVSVVGATIWGGASSGDTTNKTQADYTTKDEGVALATAINTNTANITTNKTNITALQTTVGDDSSGLVKDVADLKNAGYQTADQVGSAIDTKLGSYTNTDGMNTAIGDAITANNANYTTTTVLETTYATKTELTNGLAGKQNTLTAEQLAAANSGITTEGVTQIATNKTDIATANGKITTLETTVGNASSGLVKAVADNTTAIANNATAINENKTNITANKGAIDKLNGDVNTTGSVLNSVRENAENAKFTPAGNISATTIGGALSELDTEKANLAGGNTFTGAQTFQDNISVGGNTTVGGTLGVTGDTSLKNTNVDGTLGVTGDTSLKNTTVGGTLGVTGAATFENTLAVTGKTTLGELEAGNTKLASLENTGNATIGGTLGVTGDTSLKNTNVAGKLEVTGNTTVGGTLGVTGNTTVGGTLGVTGAATLNNTLKVAGETTLNGATTVNNTLTVTGAATLDDTLTVDGLTTLSSTNGMTFDGTTVVKSIDAGATAVTGAGDATKLATTATVMKSAENAGYSGTTKLANGSAPTTIKDALNVIGDVSALTTSTNFTNGGNITVETISDALQGIDKTLGKIHGLVDASGNVQSTTVPSTTGTGSNLARGTTVEDHLVSLDNAIGNRTAMTNTMAVEYTDAGIAGKDLSTALSQVASNIGTATTTTFNGVAADATVNANIDAINTALGDVVPTMATTHYAAGTTNLSDAVKSIDEKLYSLDNDVKSLKKDFQAGMAEMAALSALVPNARATGDTQISFGTGAYEGHTAAALGGFHWINDNVMLNIGASWGNSSNAAYRAGITYSW